MTSFPSTRVAMPTVPSSGGEAPFSGSNRGVSGIEGVSPSSTTWVEGANSVGAWLGSTNVGVIGLYRDAQLDESEMTGTSSSSLTATTECNEMSHPQ